MDIKLSQEGKIYKMSISWYDEMKPVMIKREVKSDTIPKVLQKLQEVIAEYYGKNT